MSDLGVYEVVGRRAYRGHQPGEVFEARLDPAAEARAIARRSIRLVDRVTADLIPGSYRLPQGWPTPETRRKEVS